MAKFVIAGRADCSSYARVEMLSEQLAASLPHFRVHKVVLPPEEWSSWLSEQCAANDWNHSSSPLVWRELVDRGGKGLYVGGLEEFEQYAKHYYSASASTNGVMEESIASENASALMTEKLLQQSTVGAKPLHVAITNAGSLTAYHLAQHVATGVVFGNSCRVFLHLLAAQDDLTVVGGVAMELADLASPLLSGVCVSSSPKEAFNSVSKVFMLDFPLNSTDTLDSAALHYHNYATTLDFCAEKDVQVIVAGKYANTGAGIIAQAVTSLPKTSFIAAPCLAEEQAKAVVAGKLGLCSSNVHQVAIWGRTQGGLLADLTHTRVENYPGAVIGPHPFTLPLSRCVFEPDWTQVDFPQLVAARHCGSKQSALAEAVSLAKLAAEWSKEGTNEWRSVGIVGGEYGAHEKVAFSQPAHLVDGVWQSVSHLTVDKTLQNALADQTSSLLTELDSALLFIKPNNSV